MSDFPNALHASFKVEFATEDPEEARAAVLDWQDRLRDEWRDRDIGVLHIGDLAGIVADFSAEQQPLLGVIMQALVERGWRIEGKSRTMIAPDVMGGLAYSLADAIGAQTFREIGEA